MGEPSKLIPGSLTLQKAVQLDQDGLYSEAIPYYKQGIESLLLHVKTVEIATEKEYLMQKVSNFIKRTEQIRELLKPKDRTASHEHIQIDDNRTGFSYRKIFLKYLDDSVTDVTVKDPYIRIYHQVQNFLRFVELLLTTCRNLKTIELTTCKDESYNSEQFTWLNSMQTHLCQHKVKLKINVSTTLHDRSVYLNTGWMFKLGRGLDYFKSVDKFCPGYHELDLRPCHETSIDIYRYK